jgi:hypothetical protein
MDLTKQEFHMSASQPSYTVMMMCLIIVFIKLEQCFWSHGDVILLVRSGGSIRYTGSAILDGKTVGINILKWPGWRDRQCEQ